MRRGLLAVVLAALTILAMPARAQDKQRLVTFGGRGVQRATLSVGSASTVAFPPFSQPRLDGPDGTVSGVLVQRGAKVVGGAVLLNAPGFEHAIVFPIGDFDGMHLAAGRYRVTTLGNTRQSLTAVTGAGLARKISLGGPARPITRSFSTAGAPLDRWSERLGVLKAGDSLLLGLGAGGAFEAHLAESCLQHGDTAPSGPCLQGANQTFAGPDGASWSGSMQSVGSDGGPFVYSGQIEAAGLGVTAGHVAVVISPRG